MNDKIIIPGNWIANPTDQNNETQFICNAGQVSDGYHTFDELYEHRCLLFCAMSQFIDPDDGMYAFKSKYHSVDGKLEPVWDGWFLAGISLGVGMITYHLPMKYWDMFNEGSARSKLRDRKAEFDLEHTPHHDGHTSKDVLLRLQDFCEM